MNFPKNIFQIWFVIKSPEIPDIWKEAQKSVIDMNPGWNYKLVNEQYADNIVKENFPDFYQTYISFPYTIQRIDAIRYCLLYLYGGIYLDLDFICNKPFNDLYLTKEVGLIYSNNGPSHFTNCFLVSQKNSQFWLYCINEMKKGIPFYKKITKHFEIMSSTGPYFINNMANKYPQFISLLKDIQSPCDYCNRDNCEYNEKYYLKPLKGDSWHSWDSKLLYNLYCNRIKIILLIIFLIFLIKKLKLK